MATAVKKCKVCDIEYEYCHTARRTADVFRYQDVACSPECGAIYFERIEKSRAGESIGDKLAAEDADIVKTPVTNFDYLAEYDNENKWFEADFDD